MFAFIFFNLLLLFVKNLYHEENSSDYDNLSNIYVTQEHDNKNTIIDESTDEEEEEFLGKHYVPLKVVYLWYDTI